VEKPGGAAHHRRLASYWIYQHLATCHGGACRRPGVRGGTGGGGRREILDEFAERADREPETARWSYAQDFGGTRLIVVDSRASRLLTATAARCWTTPKPVGCTSSAPAILITC